jgi:hypothetical protein
MGSAFKSFADFLLLPQADYGRSGNGEAREGAVAAHAFGGADVWLSLPWLLTKT